MPKLLFFKHRGFFLRALADPVAVWEAPLAVLQDGVVLEASPVAEQWGIGPGISKRLAKRRLPVVEFVDFEPERCRPLYEQVWSLYAGFTPRIEPVDLSAGFLDVTGCGFGQPPLEQHIRAWAWRLHFELGLTLEWGGGEDRWLAALACGENRLISPAEEADFLRRTPAEKLLPEDLCDRLKRFSVFTVADVLGLPRSFWERHLQQPAAQMEPLLRRGEVGVQALFPPPRIHAGIDLEWADKARLLPAAGGLCDDIAAQLRAAGLQAHALKLEFCNRERRLCLEEKPSKGVAEAAPLLRLLLDRIIAHDLRRLERITITCERLLPRAHAQADLWQNPLERETEAERLAALSARLQGKYGPQTLRAGAEYARTVPPRFAQLIWQRQGRYLP